MGPWTNPRRILSSLVRCWQGQKYDFASFTLFSSNNVHYQEHSRDAVRKANTEPLVLYLNDKILAQDYFTVI